MRKLSFEIKFGKPEKVEGENLDVLNENMCVLARVIEQQVYVKCKEEGYYADYVKVMNLIQEFMGEGNLEAAKKLFGAIAMICDKDLMALMDAYVYSDELSSHLFFDYLADCIADSRVIKWVMDTSDDKNCECDDFCDEELCPIIFDEIQEARERRDENE